MLIQSLITHLPLVKKLTKREIVTRYKGSIFGILWTLINPIIMLMIYTVVFSEIFNFRWGGVADESKAMFALMVFSGMLVLSFFNEVLIKSPALILINSNFVKKVIFPLEVLPFVAVLVALFQMLTNILILMLAVLLIKGSLPLTTLFIPIVLLPLIVLSTGFALGLAALGVYFRDLRELVATGATILMFLSPIFYPISAVPGMLKSIIMLNPITFIIEQLRLVLISAQTPDFQGLVLYSAVAFLVCFFGYRFFRMTRRGFADVI